jgi:Dynamin family
MNISMPGQELEPEQITFSDDVLKIELCGPHRENLSIIDIPGIFRTPTEGVTSKAGMLPVKAMVRGYIKDERTIILAVLPAPTDIATQSILTMTKEADPLGLRTLGVLTKPDLVDKGGEQSIMDLVLGSGTNYVWVTASFVIEDSHSYPRVLSNDPPWKPPSSIKHRGQPSQKTASEYQR